MIQRIQTVYLLIGALLLALLFVFRGIWTGPAAVYFGWFAAAGQILCALTVAAAVAAVFSFTDRRRQRKIIIGAQFLDIAFMFVLYLGLTQSGVAASALESPHDWIVLITMFIPIIVYILFYLARRGVERDIALVRSMDRLR